MNKGSGLRLSVAAKISLHGNWVTRIFTIIILSICFTAFGLISVFYTGNYRDTCIKSMLNSANEYSGFSFYGSYELYDQSDYSVLGQELIDYIKDETKTEYVYAFGYNAATINCSEYCGRTGMEIVLVDGSNRSGMYADSEKAYENLGFKVLAGRYPEGVYEIAISEKQFEYFQQNGGYCDRSEGFYDDGEGYWRFDGSRVSEQRIEEINDYEDIIGKTVMCTGDVENGVLGSNASDIVGQGKFYFVKIVGVIDIHYDESIAAASLRGYDSTLGKSIFYSKEWVNTFSPGGDYLSMGMYTKKVKTYAEASYFFDVANSAKKFVDTLIAKKQAEGKALNATSDGVVVDEMSSVDSMWQYDSGFFLIFIPAGIVFGIFAIVLVIFLTSATLKNQRKQIGVLRALGLNKSGIRRVVWSGMAFVSALTLTLSIITTLLLYWLWIFPIFNVKWLGVSFVFFNIWNVLLLAALAFIVPLLASIPSILRFSKRSVAEILTDRSASKKRRERNAY